MQMARSNEKSISDYRKPSKPRSWKPPVRIQEIFVLNHKQYNEKTEFSFPDRYEDRVTIVLPSYSK